MCDDPYLMMMVKHVCVVNHMFFAQVFADLPSSYLLNPACVDKGEYIDHGSFGDIYHGAVYPSVSATVCENIEVAKGKLQRSSSKVASCLMLKQAVSAQCEEWNTCPCNSMTGDLHT